MAGRFPHFRPSPIDGLLETESAVEAGSGLEAGPGPGPGAGMSEPMEPIITQAPVTAAATSHLTHTFHPRDITKDPPHPSSTAASPPSSTSTATIMYVQSLFSPKLANRQFDG